MSQEVLITASRYNNELTKIFEPCRVSIITGNEVHGDQPVTYKSVP